MKLNIIKQSLFAGLAVLSLVAMPACRQTDKEIFDKGVNQRVDDAAKALLKRLADAPEGWILEYIPGKEQKYGGYYIGLKFSAKGEVLATTEELADPTKWVKSEFTIGKDKNLSINFDTYNEALHRYTTPDTRLGGGQGTGFEGDHEFNIAEYVSDDVIKLRGKRTGGYMYLYKAKEPIDQTIASILALKAKAYSRSSMFVNYQDKLVGNLGGKEQYVGLNKDGLNVLTVETKGEAEAQTISYFYTATGIKLVKPLEGITELTWNDTEKRYETANGQTLTARIDPAYDKYARYLGNYTFTYANGRTPSSVNVEFVKDGFRRYRIVGHLFDFYATYNAETDAFEITNHVIGRTADNRHNIVLSVWDTNAGYLIWSVPTSIALVSKLVDGSNPEQYTMHDNAVWRERVANAFILWNVTDANTDVGEDQTYSGNTRYGQPVFTRR